MPALQNIELQNYGDWPYPLKVGVTALTFIIVTLLGLWLDGGSMLKQLQNVRNQEENLKSQYIAKMALLSEVNNNVRRVDDIKKVFAAMKLSGSNTTNLGSEFRLAELLEDITRIAMEDSVRLKLLKPGDEKIYDFYAVVPIEIIALGDFIQVASFISDLANLNQPLTIRDFIIEKENAKTPAAPPPATPTEAATTPPPANPLAETTNSNSLVLTLTAEIYRYKERQKP